MKYLILFFSLNLFAGDFWIDATNLENCRNGISYHSTKPSLSAYPLKAGMDCAIMTIQDVEIDDHDKPFYDIENVIPCAGEAACKEQLKPTCEVSVPEGGSIGYEVCHSYCEDFVGFDNYINEEYTETYCAKLGGYYQKIKKELKEDATLKAAKAAKQALEAQAKLDKKSKKKKLESTIDTCLALDENSAKTKDLVKCVLPLIKYIRGHK